MQRHYDQFWPDGQESRIIETRCDHNGRYTVLIGKKINAYVQAARSREIPGREDVNV